MYRYVEDDGEVLEPVFRYTRLKVALAFLMIVFILLFQRIVIFVNAGQAAVLFHRFFGGVVLNKTYGEGIHVIFPWDRMTVYNVRIQEVPIEYDVLTSGGLTIKMKVSVRFHPSYDTLAYLHDLVGPDYIHKVVIPVVQYAVRTVVGSYSLNEVYANKDDMIGRLELLTSSMLAQKYVTLDGVLLKDIELPPSIRVAIQDKERQRQLLESYEFRVPTARQEALRKQLEALGWQRYNQIIAASVTDRILMWNALSTTRALATSDNAKMIVIGSGPNGLPVLLAPQLNELTKKPAPVGTASISSPLTETTLDQATNRFDGRLRKIYAQEVPPSVSPTSAPAASPTAAPTAGPTAAPTASPKMAPAASPQPLMSPTSGTWWGR